MGAWVVGHNLAGYLPESDTVAYEEWSDAVEQFEAMACEYADDDDEANDADEEPDWTDEDYGSMRAHG